MARGLRCCRGPYARPSVGVRRAVRASGDRDWEGGDGGGSSPLALDPVSSAPPCSSLHRRGRSHRRRLRRQHRRLRRRIWREWWWRRQRRVGRRRPVGRPRGHLDRLPRPASLQSGAGGVGRLVGGWETVLRCRGSDAHPSLPSPALHQGRDVGRLVGRRRRPGPAGRGRPGRGDVRRAPLRPLFRARRRPRRARAARVVRHPGPHHHDAGHGG